MSSLERSEWLGFLEGSDDHSLVTWPRLGAIQKILAAEQNSPTRYPSLVMLYGYNKESSLLESFLPGLKPSDHALVNLSLETRIKNTPEDALLLATVNPAFVPFNEEEIQNHRSTTTHRIRREKKQPLQSLADELIASLLFNFASVLCLFVDPGGLNKAIAFLSRLKAFAPTDNNFFFTRPRVLLIHSRKPKASLSVPPEISASYPLSTVQISTLQLTSWTRFAQLRDVIAKEIHHGRIARKRSHLLFAEYHFLPLIERAVQHFLLPTKDQFNYLQAACQDSRHDDAVVEHLRRFLQLAVNQGLQNNVILPFIGSALFMDFYNPGMHPFEPGMVFKQFYEKSCFIALKSHLDQSLAIKCCREIETTFLSLFLTLKSTVTSEVLRMNTLSRQSQSWTELRSSKTCLWCLQRKPEHNLECKHSICDTCVKIFGEPAVKSEYRYSIKHCILCSKTINNTIRLIPPTAGVRTLSIDGGGIRGVIPLEYLKALEQELNLPYPLQEMFDVAFGTSSGALIVIGLFVKGWGVSHCISIFQELAKQLFLKETKTVVPCLSRLYDMFLCCFKGSRYDATTVEKILRGAFGEDRLFGASETKVGLTATSEDPETWVLPTYNGKGDRRKDPGYEVLDGHTILTWEAARCSTAAPPLFSPYELKEHQLRLHDGGLGANFPGALLWTETDIIHPSQSPDLSIFIGTGHSDPPRPRNDEPSIVKLFKVLLANSPVNAQKSWRDHSNALEKNGANNRVRLNLPLTGLPELYEVEQMEELQRCTQRHVSLTDFIPFCSDGALATEFFFELSSEPETEPTSHRVRCRGHIRSRYKDSPAVVHRVLSEYPHAEFMLKDGSCLALITKKDVCYGCSLYLREVEFVLRDQELCQIFLSFQHDYARHIAGFSKGCSLSKIKCLQELGRPFGNSDYQQQRFSTRVCVCHQKKGRMTDRETLGPKRCGAGDENKLEGFKRRRT